jgi:carboxymethylenebutenolidase
MSGSGAQLKRSGMIDMEANSTLVQQRPAHEAVPGFGPPPFPSVIVLHDIFGLDAQTRAMTNRLAREGFYAIAPNFYGLPFSLAAGAPDWMSSGFRIAGDAELEGMPVASAFDHREREEAQARWLTLSDRHALDTLQAAMNHLALVSDAVSAPVGLLGFGAGGHLGFLGACELGSAIGAAALFSPNALAAARRSAGEGLPLARFEGISCPLMIFYGAQDDEVRRQEREAVATVLRSSGKPHEIVEFPEAEHRFFDGESEELRIGAAKEAWMRTIDFFSRTLARSRP